MSMRIRGVSSEGEDLSNLTVDLQKYFDAYGIGFDILDESTGEIASTYDVLLALSSEWENLTDIQKSNITEIIAGKRQSDVLNSVLTNQDTLVSALTTSQNSYGSALAENAEYMDSIEAKTAQFTATLQNMWQNAISSDLVKQVVDLGTALISLVDSIGLIPVALTLATTAFIAFKTELALKIFTAFDLMLADFVVAIINATTVTEGLTGALQALNLGFLANPIVATIAGIVALMGTLIIVSDAFTTTIDEQTEALSNARAEYEEVTSELQSLQEQVESNNESIQNLYDARENLSDLTNSADIANLKLENQLLENQISLLESEQKIKAAELIEETMEGDQGFVTIPVVFDTKEFRMIGEDYSFFDSSSFEDFNEAIDSAIGSYNNLNNLLDEGSISTEEYNEKLSELSSGIIDINEADVETVTNLNAIREINGDLTDDQQELYDSTMDRITATNLLNEALASGVSLTDIDQEQLTESAHLINQLTENMDTLTYAYETVANSEMTAAEQVEYLTANYDELVAAGLDVQAVLNGEISLREAVTQAMDNQQIVQAAVYSKMSNFQSEYLGVSGSNWSKFYDIIANYYEGDFENFTSLADAKYRVDTNLINSLSTSWSSFYSQITAKLGYAAQTIEEVRAGTNAVLTDLGVAGAGLFYTQSSIGQQIMDSISEMSALSNISVSFTGFDAGDYSTTSSGDSYSGDSSSGSDSSSSTSTATTQAEYQLELENLINDIYRERYEAAKQAKIDLYDEKIETLEEELDLQEEIAEQQIDALEEQLDLQQEILDTKIEALEVEKEQLQLAWEQAEDEDAIGELEQSIAETEAEIAKIAVDKTRATEVAELEAALADYREQLADERKQQAYETAQAEIEAEIDSYENEQDLLETQFEAQEEAIENELTLLEEQTEAEIAILEEKKEYWQNYYDDILSDSSNYYSEVSAIMKKSQNAIISFLKSNVDEYKTAGKLQRQAYVSEWSGIISGAKTGSSSSSSSGSSSSGSTTSYPYGKASSTSGNIGYGARGTSVKAIQWALQKMGYNLGSYGVDGQFGAYTKNAVKSFQSKMGITSDGIVGVNTRAKFKAKGYASGGKVDYTGLAMLHGGSGYGSEYVINQEQLKNIVQSSQYPNFMMEDVMKYAKSGSDSTSTTNNDNNIVINVNGYNKDVTELAKEIAKQTENTIKKYSGNNQLATGGI